MGVVIIDDILISGETDEQHVENLKLVLEKLAELGLTVNFSKCKFSEKEIDRRVVRIFNGGGGGGGRILNKEAGSGQPWHSG